MDLGEQVQEVVLLLKVAWVAGGGDEEAEGYDGTEDGDHVGEDDVLLFCKQRLLVKA